MSSPIEQAVRERYSQAAAAQQPELCCPTVYDPRYLAAIPAEVIERDYGCGDPSRHLAPGETVLDLGAGGGKVCFLASQVVGRAGRVIGVDMNDDMLALARGAAPEVARRIGYANVEFRKGKIQDLALDRDRVDGYLREHPVRTEHDLVTLEAELARLRATQPLIASASIDVVVSNCVLNLVDTAHKAELFREIFRVLRRGGRAIISDIVSDEDVPAELAADEALWSGCISGAYREDALLEAFEAAGFHGIELLSRQREPWQTVAGIEFRSVTVAAYKGKQGPCLEQHHAVIYRGPFREALDDDGHVYRRGVRTAVCAKTFELLTRAPYRDHFEAVEPALLVPLEQAAPFACTGGATVRAPRETKAASAAACADPAAGQPGRSCC